MSELSYSCAHLVISLTLFPNPALNYDKNPVKMDSPKLLKKVKQSLTGNVGMVAAMKHNVPPSILPDHIGSSLVILPLFIC